MHNFKRSVNQDGGYGCLHFVEYNIRYTPVVFADFSLKKQSDIDKRSLKNSSQVLGLILVKYNNDNTEHSISNLWPRQRCNSVSTSQLVAEMEHYSYYGSGRFFAVTNAYPPTSEVYNVAIDPTNFTEKPGEIDAQALDSNRREGYEQEAFGNERQNAELDKEPPSHETSTYDNNIRNRKDEARWRYKDIPIEGHNVWEPKRNDGRDINSNKDPEVDQQFFAEHPMHGRGHEQLSKEYEIVDNEKAKKEYTGNERKYELPEPTLYHDRYTEDARDVNIESGKERYKSNNTTVNEENKVWKNHTVNEQEHQKPTDIDVADNKFPTSAEKLGRRDDQSNIYSDLPISEKPKYPEPYQEKEIEKSKEVRPYNSIKKYDTSEREKLFRPPERSSEKWRNKGIDDKLLFFKNREKEHTERLGQQQKGTGDYRTPSTAKQGNQKIPVNDRSDAKGTSQMDETKKSRGYEDMRRNRDYPQSYPIPNRYVGEMRRPNEENKYQNEVAEQGRSKNDKARLPENDYFQKNAEKKSKMAPHENFNGKPIEQVHDIKDIREGMRPQNESIEYGKYNDQPQNDFEIDVDEIYESKEEVNVQADNPIEEEIIHEEFHEIQSEPMALDVLDDDDEEENDADDDDDWPLPPEDKIILQEEKELINDHETPNSEARLDYLQTQRNEIATKEDGSLYTSFLTIDVTSGKRENFDGPTLSESKHRSSLLNLVSFNQELEHAEDIVELDKEDMDKIRHDVEMISKYLHNIPLGASHWPQNYDVLRDLVKLYLASKTTSVATLNYLLDYFLKLDWPGLFLKCLRRIMKSYPQVFVHASDKKVKIFFKHAI